MSLTVVLGPECSDFRYIASSSRFYHCSYRESLHLNSWHVVLAPGCNRRNPLPCQYTLKFGWWSAYGSICPTVLTNITEKPCTTEPSPHASLCPIRLSIRAGNTGARVDWQCQPNRNSAAGPHTRPWHGPIPQRVCSFAARQPGIGAMRW